jgi:hypothetical protein
METKRAMRVVVNAHTTLLEYDFDYFYSFSEGLVWVRQGEWLDDNSWVFNKWGILQIQYEAVPIESTAVLNGNSTRFNAYSVGDDTYYKLRDVAYVLNNSDSQFEIRWSESDNVIAMSSNTPYTPVGGEMLPDSNKAARKAIRTRSKVYLDGMQINLESYTIGGNNYFKLCDLVTALY